MNPDQPAPKRVVCSRSILFVIQATKVHRQITKQTVFVMVGSNRLSVNVIHLIKASQVIGVPPIMQSCMSVIKIVTFKGGHQMW